MQLNLHINPVLMVHGDYSHIFCNTHKRVYCVIAALSMLHNIITLCTFSQTFTHTLYSIEKNKNT